MSNVKEGMEMGGKPKARMKCKGFGRSILKICKISILRNRWQFTCVALMGSRELTTSEESLLEEVSGEAQEWRGCR